MKSILMLSALALGTTTANAELYTTENTTIVHPVVKETVIVQKPVVTPIIVTPVKTVQKDSVLDATVAYRKDTAANLEGTEATLQYNLNKNIVLGANVFGNSDDVHSYGTYVGTPLKLNTTNVVFTPFVGYERYDNLKVDTMNVGLKAYTPLFNKTTGLSADVKYVKDTNSNVDLEGTSFSIGLTKQF